MIIDRENNTVKDIYLLTFGVANLNEQVFNRDSFDEDIVGKEFVVVTKPPSFLEQSIDLSDIIGVVTTKLNENDLLGDVKIFSNSEDMIDFFEDGWTLALSCLGTLDEDCIVISNAHLISFILTPK